MRLTILTKLLMGFFSLLVLLVTVGATAMWGMRALSVSASQQAAAADDLVRIGELAVQLKSLQEIPSDYLAVGNRENQQKFQQVQAEAQRLLEEQKAEAANDDEMASWEQVEVRMAELVKGGAAALAMNFPVSSTQASKVMEQIDTAAEDLDNLLGQVRTMVRDAAEEQRLQTESLAGQMQIGIIAVAILAVVIGTVVAWWLAKGLSRPVRQLAAAATRLAEGDLQVEALQVRSRDETAAMATAFNKMVENLRGLIGEVSGSAREVATSAEQLTRTTSDVAQAADGVTRAVAQVARAASNQSQSAGETTTVVQELRHAITQIASGAGEQARSAQQTAEAVNRMVRALDDVAGKAGNVAASAVQATNAARSGGQVVSRTAEGMERIRETVLSSAERIRELGQASEQVGEITQVITDIAAQTNLLALNAAIEAARAGEHGRGFAVVADEVRKLAERAGTSAKEIADLIRNIQQGTAQAVQAMEHGRAEVEEGSRLAAEAGKALGEILAEVEQATRDMGAITTAAQKIAASSRDMVQLVDSVAAITEQNTAATEEMSAASDQVDKSVMGIAAASEENAAAAEEVTASIEAINVGTEQTASSAQSLMQIARFLQSQVERFRT